MTVRELVKTLSEQVPDQDVQVVMVWGKEIRHIDSVGLFSSMSGNTQCGLMTMDGLFEVMKIVKKNKGTIE